MRAYSTGISSSNDNISYDTESKTWTWTTTSSNQLTIFSFTAGTLSKFSTINWVSSGSTLASGEKYRVIFYAGSTNIKAISPYSDGTKNLNISEYLTEEQAATITSIKFSGSSSGTGSTVVDLDGIYLEANHGVGTTEDWQTLSSVVSAGLLKVNVSMTADVDAGSTMVGTTTNPYQGTFDGAGHTLTFNYSNTSSDGVAPFQYIKDATINNLATAGSITARNIFGGIVGTAGGASTLNYCSSSMRLTANSGSDSNNGRVGGLVGRCADNAGGVLNGTSITFNDCLFNGSISSDQANHCCGLISWVRGSGVTATTNNCLVAATSVTNGTQNIGTTGSSAIVTPTNCYYTTKFGSSTQGTQVSDAEIASGQLTYKLNGSAVPATTYFWGQGNLNKSTADKMPSLTNDESKKVYEIQMNVSNKPYGNRGGALPNPVRYGYTALSTNPTVASRTPLKTIPSDYNTATLYGISNWYQLTVGSALASTLVLPFDATIPENVTAYTLNYISGDQVAATKITSGTISANTPVLINVTEAGGYDFKATDYTGPSTTAPTWPGTIASNGALTGVYVQAGSQSAYNPVYYVPADSYVLQNGADGLGFYKVATDNTIRITSFRAYLTAEPGGAPSLSIAFTDEETGIQEATCETEAGNSESYNLAGQRVGKNYKGLVVKNGKKYIVK
ncbi:MAG: hypothetical protein IJP70_03545 [Bacteroidales bacterium]|nr:hypothetical protein [Bacteroidales bacterium]